MDNVTHSLTGYCLARSGLDRLCPHATALLMVSANAPDVDILAVARGPFRYFEAHRGYSHSIFSLPLLACVVVLVVAVVFHDRLPWVRAFLVCCLGIASHLLIDWTNSYGVRLLLPFSSRWFHLDLNSLYDGFILLALLFAALWPLFASLVSQEIGARSRAGRGLALSALSFFLLFDCGRAVLQNRALLQLQSRLFDDARPIETAALPTAFNPFRWNGVVETDAAYVTVPVDVLGDLDVAGQRKYFKPPQSEIKAVKQDPIFRYFAYFSRFPIWSITPVTTDAGEWKRLELTDLRFGKPGAGSFHCIALEDARARVVQSWFAFGSGNELGRSR
jgi:inner membrane protein